MQSAMEATVSASSSMRIFCIRMVRMVSSLVLIIRRNMGLSLQGTRGSGGDMTIIRLGIVSLTRLLSKWLVENLDVERVIRWLGRGLEFEEDFHFEFLN